MNVRAMRAFVFLAAGAAAMPNEGDFDSNLMQLAAQGQSQLELLGLANSSSAANAPALADYIVYDETSGPSNWYTSGTTWMQTDNIHAGTYCSKDQLGTINYITTSGPDYEWSVDVASQDNDAVGLVWRVADTNNFYKYSHTNDGGGCRTVFKIKAGARTELWRASSYSSYTQSYSTPYEFKVVAQGCRFVGYYNGAQDFDITDSDCVATGGVGLYAWGNSAGQWSNMLLTPSATPSPTAPSGVGAVGDPHLQNVRGDRFDVMQEGNHVLINIPRGMSAETSLLRVTAAAVRLGRHCADMYFQDINITGSWAEAKHVGGYHYSVSQGVATSGRWAAFGKVELKVVHGRMESGITYLNFYAKHLGRTGFDVGGLLGLDDHDDVMTPPAACFKQMSLKALKTTETSLQSFPNSVSSVAMTTFE